MGRTFENLNHLHKKLSKDLTLYFAVIIAVSLITAGLVWKFVGDIHRSISVGFHLVLIFYLVATVWLSYISFNGRRKELRQKKTLQTRLKEYNEAIGIKWLLWATIAFLSLISMFISGKFLFLAYVAVTLLLYLFDYPTKNRLDKDLQPDEEQN